MFLQNGIGTALAQIHVFAAVIPAVIEAVADENLGAHEAVGISHGLALVLIQPVLDDDRFVQDGIEEECAFYVMLDRIQISFVLFIPTINELSALGA
ncbi:MAG TPA: hypothetical protein DFI00_09390 [Rhodospirillaceae bacterium]|nr:hypothetical protein [Alphaproteobacteria bacterium]MBN54707.1 hypothetical protein [Alphaproteobacteria bacterium]HCI47497.1 hypothetical protein [Rhodospirillaceae bacterium]